MTTLLQIESDDEYNYDLSLEDEALLTQVITNISNPASAHSRNIAALASDLGVDTVAEEEFRLNDVPTDITSFESHAAAKTTLWLPQRRHRAAFANGETEVPNEPRSPPGDRIVAYPDLSKALSNGDSTPSAPEPPKNPPPETSNDTRSPLLRFRSFPRKPFTVTDLTAGAWCELQYFYTLTRLPFGRKTRTAAMKQGTKVHQDLEDEVHTTVRVEITSKEDGFGLRIWNLIQGLRTLRDTGMTRELEVWGFVDGNLVNGVIDGLSYENPDPEFEEQLSQESENPSQSSITDYFPSKDPGKTKIPQIYLTDVKTRGSMKAPNSPVMLRPAKVQLFLYHRFLSEMASDTVDYLRIFQRYNLDPDKPFSDSFIAQVGSLHDELFFDMESSSDGEYVPTSSGTTNNDTDTNGTASQAQTPAPDIIKYRTLRKLLPLLVSELRDTFPHGADSIGRLLTVEYRYRGDGSLIDSQVFPMDDRALNLYLGSTMEWWRADRKPRGVQIEEAYKCRMCEFADDCTWRTAMDEERVLSARQRVAGRKKHVSNG